MMDMQRMDPATAEKLLQLLGLIPGGAGGPPQMGPPGMMKTPMRDGQGTIVDEQGFPAYDDEGASPLGRAVQRRAKIREGAKKEPPKKGGRR
jgi:hypothetical protein